MKATIWHNPDCGTSTKTLAILNDAADVDVTVIEYKAVPYTRAKLTQIFAATGLTPKQALRVQGTDAEALGLTRDDATGDEILDAMVANPILVQRPFVETEKGVRLCRPQDIVHEIL
jgi:arsenate reductase (glutaredoxin)